VKIDFTQGEIFLKYSWVCPFLPQRNDEILEDLKVEQLDEKLRRHKSNWV